MTKKSKFLHRRYLIEEFYRTLLKQEDIQWTPIQKHLAYNFIYEKEGHFHTLTREWTMKRINKILSIYDIEFFKDKKILVLGDGIGDIGGFFADIGANVLAIEGRTINRNLAKLRMRNIKNYRTINLDLNKDFSKVGKFDIIINFGLIEAINNIKLLLECCAKISNLVIVETLVADSFDEHSVFEDDMPMECNANAISSNLGCRPSPAYIEAFFKNKGYTIKRFWDKDLDNFFMKYSWKGKGDNSLDDEKRRFWIFEKQNFKKTK